MKKTITMFFMLGSLLVAACGPTKNDPLEKYRQLKLTQEPQTNPTKEVPFFLTNDKEKVVLQRTTITEGTLVTEKPVYILNCPDYLKEKEEDYRACLDRITGKANQISLNGALYEIKVFSDNKFEKPSPLIFLEGRETTYYVQAKILYAADVKFNLDFEQLPETAVKEMIVNKTNLVQYKITWKPQSGIVKKDEIEEKDLIKVTLKDIEFIDSDKTSNHVVALTFDAISKTQELEIAVLRTEEDQTKELQEKYLKEEEKSKSSSANSNTTPTIQGGKPQ
jgi:hypothetical protein